MPSERSRGETRLALLRLLVVTAAVALIARLWQLQMVEGETYRVLADQNRYRQVDVAAPRGVIYDRNGEILARNRPSFTVTLIPADLPEDPKDQPEGSARAAALDRLLAILARPQPETLALSPGGSAGVEPALPSQPAEPSKQPDAGSKSPAPADGGAKPKIVIPDRQPWVMPRLDIEKAIAAGLVGGAYKPIPIATHVKEATAFAVAEDSINLPGVQLVLEPIRDYPTGELTSHVVGYMGHIAQEQVAE